MRVDRISAKNYRTLEDVTVSFESNYCTISGHNNAGKSCMINLIGVLLKDFDLRPWTDENTTISYKDDKTQWVKETPDIEINYDIKVNKIEDQALVSFIERVTHLPLTEEIVAVDIKISVDNLENIVNRVSINGSEVPSLASKDILEKLRSSNCIFLHNSTRDQNEYYYRSGKHVVLYDTSLSAQDRLALKEAESHLHKQVKKLAKAQTSDLNAMLGKLNDKFDVEFSTLDNFSRRVPLGISLTDKNVEMPLPSWGSGTQNRTRVLMSVLQANRLRTGEDPENKITPVVVIEEPESFLHPSAQADFGKVLQALSEELKIQIIVSTHSPYMLNQVDPKSNILMKRRVVRKKNLRTEIVITDGDQWMAPFAEHLGIIPPEFESWREILSTTRSKMVLVEGDIDKEYIEHLRRCYPDKFVLPSDVEIVPYGGKNALNNTLMIKFILSRIEKYFVTFDLDAAGEVTKTLEKIGLQAGVNFASVGVDKPGRQAIEGLLPDRVLQAVHGRETDLMMASVSGTTDERKKARSTLKGHLLEEFKSKTDYLDTELRPLFQLGKEISKPFIFSAKERSVD